MVVPLLFFCSGATALVYEVVWSKYLALIFGSTVAAQTIVLAVFMGGLAIGNRLFGRFADRSPTPLAWYGYLEGILGLYAFFFHQLYQAADFGFTFIGKGRLEQTTLLMAVKLTLSVLMLIGPTILMGGTLPLLASWLQRMYPDAGRWSARFYSINSLGAVAGSFAAGFILVRQLGLVSTLQLTAFANIIVAIGAVAVSRYQGEPDPVEVPRTSASEPASAPAPASGEKTGDLSSLRLGCMVVAVSGAISMGMEVLAARFLVMIFGGSLQAFAIVLMSFILGIGIGGGLSSSPRWKRIRPGLGAAALFLAASILVGTLVLGIERWVVTYLVLKSGLAISEMGFFYNQGLSAVISLVILGLPAACLGAVLPIWIRGAGDNGASIGAQVGRLLTWNTIGAVVGSLVTGFVLMPMLGLRGALVALVVLMALVAVVIAVRDGQRGIATAAVLVAGFVGYFGATTGEGWRQVVSSGVFRYRGADIDPKALENRKKRVEVLFHEDAPDATVTVEKVNRPSGPPDIGLRINGKVDASSRGDLATQYMLAHVPMAARPNAKSAFVLGLGSGVTAGALLGHPVDSVVVAENCGPVLKAARFFDDLNRGVLTNSRAHFFREDARTVLKLTEQRFDIIICEPSNPWMAGIGSVFSKEFYQIAASRLSDGGVMAQWFHIYEMSDPIVGLVIRTFASVFPFMEIWDPGSGDIIMLGSKTPWASTPRIYGEIFARDIPRQDLERIGLKNPSAFWARQLASQSTAFAIPDVGPMQSDHFPLLEYEAPKAFYIGQNSQLLNQYDERTWQWEIAATGKSDTLRSLPDEVFRPIFAEFASVNPYLSEFYKHYTRAAQGVPDIYIGRRLLPCVFRDPKKAAVAVSPGLDSTEWLRKAWDAESLIRTSPVHWKEGVATLASVIGGLQPPSDAELKQALSDFTALGVRTAIVNGAEDQATALLSTGLRLAPAAAELRYLARVLERRKILSGR